MSIHPTSTISLADAHFGLWDVSQMMSSPAQSAHSSTRATASGARHRGRTPKILAKACTACRVRKIRCDAQRPQCSSCANQARECEYAIEAPRKRPTFAEIDKLQRDIERLSLFIRQMKTAPENERQGLLERVDTDPETARVILPGDVVCESEETSHETAASHQRTPQSRPYNGTSGPATDAATASDILDSSSDEEPDLSVYACVNEAGEPSSFGPSSALNNPHAPSSGRNGITRRTTSDDVRNALIANAALQRQQEVRLRLLPNIDGVPTELALHLLDVHWSRQHHTFLLTYRPAIMRDIASHGPNCSRFLLNAIFACASKFSPRSTELHREQDHGRWTATHFFKRCDDLLAEDSLLVQPSIPTVVGLILLGSSYNARGQTSKGWLYTGYGLRMVFDLGLHLDPRGEKYSPEESEIRRRVFWGAFICDKLQGLYLGRPTVINLRDAHVLQEFNDTYEEHEIWSGQTELFTGSSTASPEALSIFSVSTFKHLGLLSRIMTRILNQFYVVGASRRNAELRLRSIDEALVRWQDNLPAELALDVSPPEMNAQSDLVRPPNILNLHAVHHSLVILLHRPFISDGHLRRTAAPAISWRRCSSAARSITRIALAYRAAWSLKSAPYLTSYAIYVACTIHVRNAATKDEGSHSLLVSSLQCLEELCTANSGVHRPVSIIKKLMATYGLSDVPPTSELQHPPPIGVSEPAEAHPYGPSDQAMDLDSIFSMFPSQPTMDANGYNQALLQDAGRPFDPNDTAPGTANNFSVSSNLFDSNNLYDALYGHMQGPILPWADADYDTMFSDV